VVKRQRLDRPAGPSCTLSRGLWLLGELLHPDEADLVQALPLGQGERLGDVVVLSSSITSGGSGGSIALGLGRGMSSFTAWVMIGMVMMNMIRSTSMTSMSGVVFISIIG
jgi:hypothetical protein